MTMLIGRSAGPGRTDRSGRLSHHAAAGALQGIADPRRRLRLAVQHQDRGLAVGPGHRQLTETPVSCASRHSASENESTNAFDA